MAVANWNARTDRRLAAAIDRAADALAEALAAARGAGLDVFIEIPPSQEINDFSVTLWVRRPIPTPSDERET